MVNVIQKENIPCTYLSIQLQHSSIHEETPGSLIKNTHTMELQEEQDRNISKLDRIPTSVRAIMIQLMCFPSVILPHHILPSLQTLVKLLSWPPLSKRKAKSVAFAEYAMKSVRGKEGKSLINSVITTVLTHLRVMLESAPRVTADHKLQLDIEIIFLTTCKL